jgi:hypothetical protein
MNPLNRFVQQSPLVAKIDIGDVIVGLVSDYRNSEAERTQY